MQLPDSVKVIRARYVAQYPVPQGAPGPEIEEQVRQWSIRLAEQVAFELPNQGWGTKRADPNRPISKDGLARQMDGRLWIYDMVTGAGTGSGRLVENPEAEDITGQIFVPVTPTNHLGVTSIPPSLPPLPPADLGPVMVELAALASKIATIDAGLSKLLDTVREIPRDMGALIEAHALTAEVNEQRHQAVLAALKRLDEKELHITVPDGELRVNGRVVAKLDFPN